MFHSPSDTQKHYDKIEQWSAQNFMWVNAAKTKEMDIGKKSDQVPHLQTPNSHSIERVEH